MKFLQQHEEQVREEGEKRGVKKVALNMLKNNIDDRDILLFTGLGRRELQALKKELELA